jgi:hypothetical protein
MQSVLLLLLLWVLQVRCRTCNPAGISKGCDLGRFLLDARRFETTTATIAAALSQQALPTLLLLLLQLPLLILWLIC